MPKEEAKLEKARRAENRAFGKLLGMSNVTISKWHENGMPPRWLKAWQIIKDLQQIADLIPAKDLEIQILKARIKQLEAEVAIKRGAYQK